MRGRWKYSGRALGSGSWKSELRWSWLQVGTLTLVMRMLRSEVVARLVRFLFENEWREGRRYDPRHIERPALGFRVLPRKRSQPSTSIHSVPFIMSEKRKQKRAPSISVSGNNGASAMSNPPNPHPTSANAGVGPLTTFPFSSSPEPLFGCDEDASAE